MSSFAIATHAGAFHADELMALVLLERFFLPLPLGFPKGLSSGVAETLVQGKMEVDHIPVLRTRAAPLLNLARANPHCFVVDVGGELDRSALNFDHHQGSMTEAWDDGTPLSSTGLVWLWLKEQGHLAALPMELQTALEDELIRPLDAHDNGQAICELGMTVDTFNRNNVEADVQLAQFEKAFSFMKEMLDNYLYKLPAKIQARHVLEAAWREAQTRGDAHVVLDNPLAYTQATALLKEISQSQAELLAIPGQGSRWSIISVPGEEGIFSTQCPVPEQWRGQLDANVEVGGRTVQMPFAHKTGFMCVVDGISEDVHAVARHIVEHNRQVRLMPSRRIGP